MFFFQVSAGGHERDQRKNGRSDGASNRLGSKQWPVLLATTDQWNHVAFTTVHLNLHSANQEGERTGGHFSEVAEVWEFVRGSASVDWKPDGCTERVRHSGCIAHTTASATGHLSSKNIIQMKEKWSSCRSILKLNFELLCSVVHGWTPLSIRNISLIIHHVKTKKITTVKEVWIPGLN